MMHTMKFVVLGLMLVVLSACAGTVGGIRLGAEKDLKTYSRWLARSLVEQSGGVVGKDTPIVFASLSNTNNLNTSSPLGRIVSDQMMSYFVEKGFDNVSEIRLRRSLYMRESGKGASGEFLLSRDARAIAETREVGAAVTGTYAEGDKRVIVTARLIEIATGKVIAARDVAVPKSSNVRSLIKNDDDASGAANFFSNTEPVQSFSQ